MKKPEHLYDAATKNRPPAAKKREAEGLTTSFRLRL